MDYRTIVRYSLDGDAAAREALHGVTRKGLEGLGFSKIGTASYEHANLDASQIPAFMALVEGIANCHQNSSGLISVDHLWLYHDTISK